MNKQGILSPTLFRSRLLALLVVVLIAGAAARAQQAQAPPSPPSPQGTIDGSYIVTFRPGTSQTDRAASVRRAGAELRSNYNIVNAVAIRANGNALAALQRDPSVLQIIPNRPVRAFQIGGETHRPGHGGGGGGGGSGQITPEGVKRVGVHTSTSNGAGIGVAIVDTGVDLVNTDLNDNLEPESFVATDIGTSCQDQHMHGTHVAGIVAAENNTEGVVGVAPNARLYCVRVLDQNGSGDDITVMDGLDWIGTHAATLDPPIRVVNMSLGREGFLGDNTALEGSVQALYNQGIAVVVAAGNDPSLEVPQNVPATYPWVFAISATTAKDGTASGICSSIKIKADTAAYFTTDGAFNAATLIGVTMAAPGEDQENLKAAGFFCFISSVGILSTKLGGGTTRAAGTSMSSPHVAGVAARLIQTQGYNGNRAPGYPQSALGVEQIRNDIRSNAYLVGIAPLASPSVAYTDDGEDEGIVKAP